VEINVYNLQSQIFNSSTLNNINKMRYLQKQLVNSADAKLMAVRKVTQDNRGSRTLEVDGKLYDSGESRFKLAYSLKFDGHSDPIKKVMIPPKVSGGLRPLGIPTIRDRANQMLMLLALEPEWEAKFDPNSFGFRPGYSCFDAKWLVTRQLQGGPKFFLDAYIKDCFGNICHEFLLNKLNTTRAFTSQIRAWLKAGIMEVSFEPLVVNLAGTPLGGTISSLLCNVALNGIELELLRHFPRNSIKFIRYADDILICGNTYPNIVKSRTLVSEFLMPIGLELSDEKTQICHSMGGIIGKEHLPVGVEFLGFYFRNIRVSKYKGVKSTRGVVNNFVQLSLPSRDAVMRHKRNLKRSLRLHKSANLEIVINSLSRIIKGWTTYFAVTKNCAKVFSYLDFWL